MWVVPGVSDGQCVWLALSQPTHPPARQVLSAAAQMKPRLQLFVPCFKKLEIKQDETSSIFLTSGLNQPNHWLWFCHRV